MGYFSVCEGENYWNLLDGISQVRPGAIWSFANRVMAASFEHGPGASKNQDKKSKRCCSLEANSVRSLAPLD